jgi:hypothetical protein
MSPHWRFWRGEEVSVASWWENDPTEVYWLEVTDRDDLGVDLRAPEHDESGKPNWRYSLFKQAHPGDVVLHYYKPRDAIIAASVVAGPWFARPITWGARGTFAREKGVKPHERPGFVVPLAGYRQLPVPLALSTLRDQKEDIQALVEMLARRHRGQSLYFPFELGSRPVRPLQGYAFKLPRDFVLRFPELWSAESPVGPPGAAGTPKARGTAEQRAPRSSGQGFGSSAEFRAAVESRAMRAASEHFERLGYAVEDVSNAMPFDLRATRGNVTLNVEVKGTTGPYGSVFLTRNEVDLARREPASAALFILANIQVQWVENSVVARGGEARVLMPWTIEEGTLEALQFRYTLPA